MEIISINAHLKYIEFLLGTIDESNDSRTIGDIRKEFIDKFKTDIPHMLDQKFGIIRLIPLLLIVENLNGNKMEQGTPCGRDYRKNINIIRHALAHNNFSATESGYEFKNKRGGVGCKMSYDEFVKFIHCIENDFHQKHPPKS